MAIANRTSAIKIDVGLDEVIIEKCLETVPGGRTLNLDTWNGGDVIPAGILLGFMSTTKEVCVYPFAAKGGIKAISLVNAGGSYTSGTANNVPLSGGSGKGATANLTVSSGGVVTVVTIVNAGAGYRAGDALSYNGTGGTGATFSVTETSPAKYNDDATTQGVSGVVGILRKSVMRDAPLASILTRGTVNWHALPDDYPQNHDGIDVPVTIRIKSPSDSSVL